jgi:glycosyltransferase involved in cell wall biosynthesis
MRVLMIVQELNKDSWLRGFIADWVCALAAEVEQLHVLALELGQFQPPPNVQVYSMGKEHGKNRGREVVNFYRHLGGVIGRVDVVFSHMTPRYVWLAAPLAQLYGKPQLLWFIHPRPNREIALALRLSRWVATATEGSFPIASPKVHALGHGIDTARYAPDPSIPEQQPPLILAVGRITPIKQHHILLEALALLRDEAGLLPCRVKVVGEAAAPGDAEYQAQLIARRTDLNLPAESFDLIGALPADPLIGLTRHAALVTNLTPPGSFDKAALEGMLIGKPLLTPNPQFDDLLGSHQALLGLQRHDDPHEVAQRLHALLQLSAAQRASIGADLRQRTAAAHGLASLMQQLVALMQT